VCVERSRAEPIASSGWHGTRRRIVRGFADGYHHRSITTVVRSKVR
jgi:hypothetical protein